MEIVFYKRAIPDDLQHPGYNSPVLSVSIPANWKGTDAEALEYARKLFREQIGCSDTEFGTFYRFE
jgi:hypothetical protein